MDKIIESRMEFLFNYWKEIEEKMNIEPCDLAGIIQNGIDHLTVEDCEDWLKNLNKEVLNYKKRHNELLEEIIVLRNSTIKFINKEKRNKNENF